MPYAPGAVLKNAAANHSDYDPSVQPLLKYAQEEFYLRMALTDMFPDVLGQRHLAAEAWDATCIKFSKQYVLDARVAVMVRFLLVFDTE